jgi:hypothetical protein
MSDTEGCIFVSDDVCLTLSTWAAIIHIHQYQKSIWTKTRTFQRDEIPGSALAHKRGTQTWQANVASKRGTQTWQANVASKRGKQTWHANVSVLTHEGVFVHTHRHKSRHAPTDIHKILYTRIYIRQQEKRVRCRTHLRKAGLMHKRVHITMTVRFGFYQPVFHGEARVSIR